MNECPCGKKLKEIPGFRYVRCCLECKKLFWREVPYFKIKTYRELIGARIYQVEKEMIKECKDSIFDEMIFGR